MFCILQNADSLIFFNLHFLSQCVCACVCACACACVSVIWGNAKFQWYCKEPGDTD